MIAGAILTIKIISLMLRRLNNQKKKVSVKATDGTTLIISKTLPSPSHDICKSTLISIQDYNLVSGKGGTARVIKCKIVDPKMM